MHTWVSVHVLNTHVYTFMCMSVCVNVHVSVHVCNITYLSSAWSSEGKDSIPGASPTCMPDLDDNLGWKPDATWNESLCIGVRVFCRCEGRLK